MTTYFGEWRVLAKTKHDGCSATECYKTKSHFLACEFCGEGTKHAFCKRKSRLEIVLSLDGRRGVQHETDIARGAGTGATSCCRDTAGCMKKGIVQRLSI